MNEQPDGAPAPDLSKAIFDSPPEPEPLPADIGTLPVRLVGAAGFGVIAGFLGWLLYFGVLKFTGYEVGLISIAVGWGVGLAVRIGSRGVGGLGYQILAVLITYLSIAFSSAPLIAAEFEAAEGSIGLVGWVLAFGISLAAPFLAGIENIIGLAIIGFGLYQAWAMNRRVV